MPGRVNPVVIFIDNQIVDVHGSFFLPYDFFRLEVNKLYETIVVTTCPQQPLALGVEDQPFKQPLELVARKFVRSLALLPIEDLEPRQRAEVINIPDLPDTADSQ